MSFPWPAPETGTTQEQLDWVNFAITKIMATGQAYTADGRSMTRADLQWLIPYRRELRSEVSRESAATAGVGAAQSLVRLKSAS